MVVTGLPSSGGTWTATWTYTIWSSCGSPILQSNVSWMTPYVYQTACTPSPEPLATLITCTTPYTVAANTGVTRSGNLYVNFGSPGEDGPQTVTQYGPPEALSVSVSGNGKVTSNGSPVQISCSGPAPDSGTCSMNVYYGNTITLTESPFTGYKFSGWGGNCSGTSSTCSLSMTSAKSVTATFTPIPETLTVTVSGSGSVSSSPSGINSCTATCSATFNYGTSVQLSASPASGYYFAGWSGACTGRGTCTVSMTGAKNVTATFTLPPETLTVAVVGGGSVTSSPSGIACPTTCSVTFLQGTSVTLSASPVGIYSFAGWSGACSGTSGCTVSMNNATSVSAAFTLPAGIINTVAGDGTQDYSGDGGAATSAGLFWPAGVAVDTAGNIYIADGNNNRIRKVTASTGVISTVAGDGTAGYNGDGIEATIAELYDPSGVAVDTAGNIYISDLGNSRIRKVTVSTGIISTVAGDGTGGYNGDGITATSAELGNPSGVAVDTAGNIYISDYSNNRIRKVTASTGIISTVAGNGTGGYSGDGGAATSAELYWPHGVAVDAVGNIYIADTSNNRIREVMASTGIISTVAGDGTASYNGDGIAATSAELHSPEGVAVDTAGNIYTADLFNYRVRKVTASTGIISTVAGDGTGGYNGDGIAATSAELYWPIGAAVDTTGNIYIADQFNNRIRAVGQQ